MKSPTVLNYEIRPCKFAERRMLLASFARIIGVFKQQYQYVGFGGLSFTDFKLFHRELHINTMYSIEGEYCKPKLEFNKPYSCISIGWIMTMFYLWIYLQIWSWFFMQYLEAVFI